MYFIYPFPENVPEAPPAPVISRSGLVDEVEDEDDDHQPRRRQKSTQQPVQEQRQSKNKRKKKRKKRAKNYQQDLSKQKADGKKEPDEETGEKKPDVEIEYVPCTVKFSITFTRIKCFAHLLIRCSYHMTKEELNKTQYGLFWSVALVT